MKKMTQMEMDKVWAKLGNKIKSQSTYVNVVVTGPTEVIGHNQDGTSIYAAPTKSGSMAVLYGRR